MKIYEVHESTGYEIHSGSHVITRTTDPIEAENVREQNPEMRWVTTEEVT